MKEIKIKAGLEYLLIKVFLPFLEDLIFHLMVNYFYCQQVNGKDQMTQHLNIVHSYIVKIS